MERDQDLQELATAMQAESDRAADHATVAKHAPAAGHQAPISRSQEEAFLATLSVSLHRYGTSSHELEQILQACADALDLNAAFFSTPTAIFISFPDSLENRTILKRVSPGGIDLEKLVAVDRIVSRFLAEEITIDEATVELNQLDDLPASFPAWLYVVSVAAASGAVVSFFSGGIREIAVTAVIGLLVGALEMVARWNPDFGRAYFAIASFLAALLAMAAAVLIPGLSTGIVTLGSLIVLVPGLTITIAVSELARQQLASGTSRFMGAVLLFLIIGFGVALGRNLGIKWFHPLPANLVPPHPLVFWACLLIAPLSFAVLFRTRRSDVPLIFVTCLLGYGSGRLGAELLGPQLGPALGSFTVAVFSSLLSRVLRQPAELTMVPGLMFLVPGSIGFQSLQALVEHNTIQGIQSAFEVLFVAAALVFGLLMANVFVRPRSWVP